MNLLKEALRVKITLCAYLISFKSVRSCNVKFFRCYSHADYDPRRCQDLITCLCWWLYIHLNRSDYVSWFSDVRRRLAPIGSPARAHSARLCARARVYVSLQSWSEPSNASAMASHDIHHHFPEYTYRMVTVKVKTLLEIFALLYIYVI